jgi:hypothetical protein
VIRNIRWSDRARWILVLVFVVASWLAAGSVDAQGTDRVGDELLRTDELLRRATEVVRESQSQRAQELVDQATTVQLEAWDRFRAGRAVLAGQLTLQARALAVRSITLAREDSSLRNRAAREGEKAERAWQAAREQLSDRPSTQAIRLLDEARSQMERGRLQFQEQHYEAALRLAVSAQSLIRQALGSGTGGSSGALSIARELERTDRLIDRVSEPVRESANAEAIRLLARAVEVQASARADERAGRPRVALAGTKEARVLAGRAHALVRGPIDTGSVEKTLAETDRILAQARDVIRDAGDERAFKLLEKAMEHQARALEHFREKEPRRALAETRVARSLAKRAVRLVENEDAR